MKWNEYKENFIREARFAHKSDEYCEKWLTYAEHLWRQNLPIIYDQSHFCLLVGYEKTYVYAASNASYKFYRKFSTNFVEKMQN